MSTISSRLSVKDRKTLALFYETEPYNALIKLLKLVKRNAADRALLASDFHEVKHLQGQRSSVERLEEELKVIYKNDLNKGKK